MTPGSDRKTHRENQKFFLKERFGGKSLVEKFDVNLLIAKYTAFFGHKLYENCESEFGGKIFPKNWWKSFSKDQRIDATLIQPSKFLTVENALKLETDLLKTIFQKQIARKNDFFSFPRLLGLIKKNHQYLEKWKESLIDYDKRQKEISIEN